jgi:hypothetical protein
MVLALALSLWRSDAVTAQSGPPSQDRGVRSREAPGNAPKASLRKILRSKVDQVEWDDAPLSDVIEWARERGEINVVARWNVLEPIGVTPDSPISLRLKNATMATILSEVMAQLSGTEEIRYQGIGNTVTISSRADLNRKMVVKAYAVNDLLFRIPEFSDAPNMDIQQTSGGGGGAGGGSASQNPFQGGQGGGGQEEDNRTKRERIEDLIELIKETVEPDAWRENGGEATIRAFNDTTIVVRASLEVHEKLGGPVVLDE